MIKSVLLVYLPIVKMWEQFCTMLLLTPVSLGNTMPFLLCYVGSIDTLFLTTGVGSVRSHTTNKYQNGSQKIKISEYMFSSLIHTFETILCNFAPLNSFIINSFQMKVYCYRTNQHCRNHTNSCKSCCSQSQ